MAVLCKISGPVQRCSCSSKPSTPLPVHASFNTHLHSAKSRPCHAGSPGRNCKDATWSRARPNRARLLVIRRTSAHWWEDEEEFDAIKDTVLPKRIHVVIIEGHEPQHTQASGWSAIDSGTAAKMLAAAGGKFATAFTASKAEAAATKLWRHLGQDGPPFFKKVRLREGLDILEDVAASAAAVTSAAESVWSELCSQNWRVELDYGLAGAVVEPWDELLLAVSGLAAERLLAHAAVPSDAAARGSGYALVALGGHSTSEHVHAEGVHGEDVGEVGDGGDWRRLHPTLLHLGGCDGDGREG